MAAKNGELYATLEAWKSSHDKCIAPTKARRRCNNSNGLSAKDKDQIVRLFEASAQTNRSVRSIRSWLPKMCCSRTNHHKNVRYNVGNIQRQLIVKYVSVPVLLGNIVTEYFVPYIPAQDEPRSVLTEMTSPQSSNKVYPSRGYVYAYWDPRYPGYVKIGFTGRTVEERLDDQTCFPNASILCKIDVAYPERIEQLVHRELGKYRYEIPNCTSCDENHKEFFKTSAEEAIRVIQAWSELVHEENLYDGHLQLTAAWQQRLLQVQGKASAKTLLKLLKKERRQSRRDSVDFCAEVDIDDVAAILDIFTIQSA